MELAKLEADNMNDKKLLAILMALAAGLDEEFEDDEENEDNEDETNILEEN